MPAKPSAKAKTPALILEITEVRFCAVDEQVDLTSTYENYFRATKLADGNVKVTAPCETEYTFTPETLFGLVNALGI